MVYETSFLTDIIEFKRLGKVITQHANKEGKKLNANRKKTAAISKRRGMSTFKTKEGADVMFPKKCADMNPLWSLFLGARRHYERIHLAEYTYIC
jgi:hypothetical protein